MSPRRHRLRNAFKAVCGLSAALTLLLHCFVSPPAGPPHGVAERSASEPPLRRHAAPTGSAERERGRGPALDNPKEDGVPAAAGANVLSWVLSGLSAVYLAQFASFYCQCPGLIGSSGLQPLVARPEDVDRTWLLHFVSSPELGVEAFGLVGTVLAALQLAMPQAMLRHGPAGATIFAFLWWCWHDLVIAGGRFTCYQMDVIVLDAAPLTILAALGLETQATVFGLRWLLLRLYLGGGAVKLLSCDESWRNLSALHWHFQSQPLPNPLGNAAHLFMPDSISHASTLFALVVEIGLAFLFLAPAADVRRIAFALQTALQGGIVLAGNFGSFNFMTVIIALSLLEDEDLPPAPALATRSSGQVVPTKLREELVPAVSLTSVLLAAGATAWTLHNQGGSCGGTWGAQPMVWAALLLVPFVLAATVETWLGLLLAVIFFLGSAAQLAGGLGVILPAEELLQIFDFGAARYGLFARMSGVGGRPTEVLETGVELGHSEEEEGNTLFLLQTGATSSLSATSSLTTSWLSLSSSCSTGSTCLASTLTMACSTWTTTWTTTCTSTSTLATSSTCWTPSSVTTTTTSMVDTPETVVRDQVNQQLVYSSSADVQELIRRLLAHQRRLQHLQRLTQVALDEAWRWVSVPREVHPFNANIHERGVWATIVREAQHGSGVTSAHSSSWVNFPLVMLHPGLPSSLQAIENALPGVPEHAWAGFRRRGWRRHVEDLFRSGGRSPPRGRWLAEDDRELYLVQADERREVDNWPPLAPTPLSARDHARSGVRRRGLQPRPAPVVMPVNTDLSLEGSVPHGSSAPLASVGDVEENSTFVEDDGAGVGSLDDWDGASMSPSVRERRVSRERSRSRDEHN